MIQVEDAKEKNAALSAQKEDLNGKQIRLHAKLDELTTDNRFILIQLICLWGYMMMHCCFVVVVFCLKKISCFGQEPEELTAGGGEIPGGISRGCRDPRSPQGLLIMLLLLLVVVVVVCLLISLWLLFLLILRRNAVSSNRPFDCCYCC